MVRQIHPRGCYGIWSCDVDLAGFFTPPAVRGVLNVRAEFSSPASARFTFLRRAAEPSRMTSESDLQKFPLTTFATTHEAGVGVTLLAIEGNFGVADPKAVSLARQKGGAS